MSQQSLIPGMEDRQKAEPCPEMFRIGRDGQQCLGGRPEEQIVKHAGVLPRQRDQLMRQRENDMRVRNRQEFFGAGRQPAVPRRAAALGAMPVATGNGELSITCFMESFF
jgi:hypothetical protein